jgi:hypothetical protein
VSGQNVSWKNSLNEARYGAYFPLVYGTAWVDALVMPVFGDANYTRAECVVASGEISNVLKFVVNGVEVSPTNDRDGNTYTYANNDYRYTWINNGKRSGSPCTDVPYSGNGDPYGGLAAFLFVVPKAVADPASIPSVRVLVQGPKVRKYLKITSVSGSGGVLTVTVSGANQDVNDGTTVTITGNSLGSGTWPAINGTWGPPGTFQLQGSSGSGTVAGGYVAYDSYSENPVWCLMNMLIRTNFSYSDLDLDSFIDAAAYCDQTVSYTDESNNTSTRKRFSYSIFMRERRSAADVIRGLRQSAGLMLIPSSATGKLQVIAKQTLAGQQPSAVDGSNYNSPISSVLANGTTANGYSAYHFDSSAILKRDRPTTLKTVARPVSETPNRIAFNFSDRAYTFAQSSISMVDSEDVARIGREIAGGGSAVAPEGITYYDQAYRQAKTLQAETHRGNAAGTTQGTIWAELETSFRAVHLRVGHIVHVTSARYNWSLQPFRVMKIQPARNYQTVRLTLAWHADAWYTDAYATAPGPDATNNGRAIAALRPPFVWNPAKVNPVSGDPYFAATEKTFGIVQNYEDTGDGKLCRLDLSGLIPINQVSTGVAPPLVPLQATVSASGGALPSQRSYFLAIAAKDSSGSLSALSELVRADLSASGSTFTATINSPAWQAGTSGWALFAGVSPQRLTLQVEGSGTPSSVTLSTLLASDAPAPDLAFDHLEVDLARVAFSGHVLAQVAGVGANTLTLAGVSMTTNYWSGYEVSLLASAASASIPVRNYSISSNTGTVLTLGSNPVGSVSVGDWVVIRAKPSVSGLVFTDAKAAWTANEHAGRVLRIIAGAARGQARKIASNTSTTITVDADFATAPDSTSRFIIEEPTVQTLTTPPQTNSSRTAEITLSLEVANYLGRVLRVTAFTADGNGRRGAETEAPTREVYVTGVRVSTSTTKTPFDYGAVGDGTTDDTAAVQACVDAVSACQIPAGYTFLVSGVTVTGKTNFRIFGGGALKQKSASSGWPLTLKFAGCAGVTAEDLVIDGNKAAVTAANAHALMFYGCTGKILISGVAVKSAKTSGIEIYSDTTTTIDLLSISDSIISDCGGTGVDVNTGSTMTVTAGQYARVRTEGNGANWYLGPLAQTYTAYGCPNLSDVRVPIAGPAAPTSVSATPYFDGTTFGFNITVAHAASIGTARKIRFEAQYYLDAGGATPDSPWMELAAGDPVDVSTYEHGPYAGATYNAWAKIRGAYVNYEDTLGAWAYSGLLAIPASGAVSGVAPGVPGGLGLALIGTADKYGVTATFTAPSSPGGMVEYEVELKFFLDAACTTPDGEGKWMAIGRAGIEESTHNFGLWDRPIYQAYAKGRVRSVNAAGDVSAWVYGTDVINVAPMAAPSAPTGNSSYIETDTSGVKNKGIPSFRFRLVASAPSDLTLVQKFIPEAQYYTDLSMASPISNWMSLGGDIFPDNLYMDTDWWPLPETACVARVRICCVNQDGDRSDWTYTGALVISSSSGLDPAKLNTSNLKGMTISGGKLQPKTNNSTVELDASEQLKVKDGSIGTTQLTASDILVGSGGTKPARFRVVDAYGNIIAFIGDDSAGFLGIYAQRLRVAPSFSSTQRIEATASGVALENVPFTMSGNDGVYNFSAKINSTQGVRVENSSNSYNYSKLVPGAMYLYNASGNQGFYSATQIGIGPGSSNEGITAVASSGSSYMYVGPDSSYNIRIACMSSGSAVVCGRPGAYVDFPSYKAGSVTMIDENRNYRFYNVNTENLVLSGLTATKWIPAYDSSGNWIGKIPIIP